MIRLLKTAVLATAMAAAFSACVRPKAHIQPSPINPPNTLAEAIVSQWFQQWPDRKIIHYLAPSEFQLPIVQKLKTDGYSIEPTSEPKPPRDSWDTDESVRWVELTVNTVRAANDAAKVTITTRWLTGSRNQEISFVRRTNLWQTVEK